MMENTVTAPIVEQRPLGGSAVIVPALGVGVMSWGFDILGYGKTHTRDDAEQAYRTCLNLGLNFFDTAEGYGNGESERLLGQFRRNDGRPILIASKFGPQPWRSSAAHLQQALDGSLERLGVEYLDLYQIHTPPPRHKLDELLAALAQAVRAGKIRAVGVSNFSPQLMRHAHAQLATHGVPLASNQVHYSLLHRYLEGNGLLTAARELNIALIAYGPLAEGVLTGKFRQNGASLSGPRKVIANLGRFDPFGETRGVEPYWQHLLSTPRLLQREKLEPLFKVLEEIAQTHQKTIGQVALNWAVTTDPHLIPIPGAKNPRQARDNAGALGWHLTPAEHARISQAEIATRQNT